MAQAVAETSRLERRERIGAGLEKRRNRGRITGVYCGVELMF